MSHVTVSLLYACLQLVVSLGFIGMTWVMQISNSSLREPQGTLGSALADNSNIVLAHWIYLIVAIIVLAVAYVLFKKKYYWMHEEYLRGIGK